VLAPLTRGRAGDSRVPNEMMGEYYSQRVDAGLMISEATTISEQANGWIGSPGIYNDDMENGWSKINKKITEANGKLFSQLWHTGRASHSDFHKGKLPVSASKVRLVGGQIHTPQGEKDYEVPRALEISEIHDITEDYKKAAIRAKAAGFAGIEIHAANGYLPNQFLESRTNKRTDMYGGIFENRYQFLKEILEKVFTVFSSDQVAIRISPNGIFNDMGSPDNREFYNYVISELDKLDLAYLHVLDGLAFGFHDLGTPYTLADVRKIYSGTIMGNCGYDTKTAVKAIEDRDADLISFGRVFITNLIFLQELKIIGN
jgi:N-ethylmaleimide reductase